ncbi:hypothetical protein AB0D67_38545 [Streptosporangium sp. NPDC048047]|uniref:hypothetical protein n=1 Tax=Streptosporangium sp. NPDC048047 TaxID=3155748 RepID=UPI003413903C
MGVTAQHRTSVVIRLAGEHDTLIERHADTIRVGIPGAVITISHHLAARSIWTIWREAEKILPRIFTTDGCAAPYPAHPKTLALASIAYSGWIKSRELQGKIARYSPSGHGELKVKVGTLIIICDDRPSATSQIAAWARMYRLAQSEVWPGSLGER